MTISQDHDPVSQSILACIISCCSPHRALPKLFQPRSDVFSATKGLKGNLGGDLIPGD